MNIRLSDHFTYRRLLRFTLPSIAMMLMTSVYSIVDGWFVSNFAGRDPFAAVNLIIPFVMGLSAFGFMFGAGGSALASYHLGAGEPEEADRVFSMLMELMGLLGILISIPGYIFMPQIADLLGASPLIREDAILYGRILIPGVLPAMLQVSTQSFLATAEQTRLGLLVSIAAGLANIVGDLLLVYVLRLGVAGAAIATLASQLAGGLLPLLYFLLNKRGPLHLRPTPLRLRPILKACGNGASELLTNIAMSLVSALYNLKLIELAQEDGVAAYGAIMYVSFIFMAIFFGFTVGYGPVIGYHYGAANRTELKSLLRKGLVIMAVAGVAMTTLAELLAAPIARLYVGYDAHLCEMTRTGFMLFSISYLLSGFNILGSSFFTGLGNGAVSAAISFLRTLVLQIAAIELLPPLFGLNGIWCAVNAAEAATLIVTVAFFIGNAERYGYR